MARARKSHESGKEDVKSPKTSLPPAYSGRVGGDNLVVYADLQRDTDPYARVLILKFAAKYAARYFIDLLIKDDTWEECDPVGKREGLNTASGVRITMFGKTLWELLEYKMSTEERAWEDELVKQNTLRFKYGVHEGAKAAGHDNEEPEHGTNETLSDGRVKVSKSKGKGPRTPKEPKVKVDKSNLVTAVDIAGDSKLEGREIRGILRASGFKKPDVGWAWPKGSPELKAAEKIIKDGIKALLKKKGKK